MCKFVSIIILALVFSSSRGQSLSEGNWQGKINYGEQMVAFSFQVSGGNIILVNGEDERVISNYTVEGDSILIPMTPFDATLKAKFTSTSMNGYWIKEYRSSRLPFTATYGQPRFKSGQKSSLKIDSMWSITFRGSGGTTYPGVGVFQQYGNKITGTIMTEISDFRYFEGILYGDSIKLTAFDGSHAFLFIGKWENEEWKGEIYFDKGYVEEWTARYDDSASIQHPFEVIEVEEGEHKPYYDLLGAGSGPDAIDPFKYKDKVLLIQVFGTWCPNSYDQTNYLTEHYEEFRISGVEILSTAFEPNYSREYGMRRIEEYKNAMNIPYDVVLGGRLSKVQAALPFPFIDKINAFPTLVIVDKKGFVRKVQSYFNGPATGQFYQDFDLQLKEILKELTEE